MHISMNNAAAAASDREAVITEDRDQVLRRVATLEATLQRCKHKLMISLDEIPHEHACSLEAEYGTDRGRLADLQQKMVRCKNEILGYDDH